MVPSWALIAYMSDARRIYNVEFLGIGMVASPSVRSDCGPVIHQ